MRHYYSGGCRCAECVRKHRDSMRARCRRLGRDCLIPAWLVADHLWALSRQGVGLRSVADASDVSFRTLCDVRSGRQARIRSRVADRLLALDAGAAADHCLVDPRPTWRLLREIRAAGWTNAEVAHALGLKSAHAHLAEGSRVFASTALRVRRLHAEVMREAQIEREARALCRECGLSHAPEHRQQVLRRLLPGVADEIRDAHPCWWGGPPGSAAERRFYRDVAALGATSTHGWWELRAPVAQEAA